MTAIAGLWQFRGNTPASSRCGRMLANLASYGRDDQNQWSARAIALGRCLARVLPEDAFDDQPLVSCQTGAVIVADIRMDNRDEIARLLQLEPRAIASLCDSALLLAAYDKWGTSCVDRIVGDFAFAIWDPRVQHFILGRDPFGQRPLYYHASPALFAFSSMPKGLHALAEIPFVPSCDTTAQFLALIPVAEKSFHEHIQRLPTGHIAVVTRPGDVSLHAYWRPNPQPLRLKRPEDYIEGYRFYLDQAVHSCLRGATNVAAQLSAGFDSSAVAATAARLLAPNNGRVVAFTAVPRRGYTGGAHLGKRIFDEGPVAAETAAMYENMDHVRVYTGATSPFARLDDNLALFEQPVFNICNQTWLNQISSLSQSRGLKVLLNGQLGNNSISYAGTEFFAELFARGRLAKWFEEAHLAMRHSHFTYRSILAATLGPYLPERLWEVLSKWKGVGIGIHDRCALTPEFLHQMKGRTPRGTFTLQANGFLRRYQALRSVDNGNMNAGTLAGWNLDCRDPSADRRLVEFCLSVPTEQFFFHGIPKSLARRALADRLPPAVLESRQKAMQYIDWHESVTADRKNLAKEISFIAASPLARSTVDVARLRWLLDNWPSGGWERFETWFTYRAVLLRAISAGHFLRQTGYQ